MRSLISVVIFFVCGFIFSQEVTILDIETNFPIENCTVYGENNTKVVYSDKFGKVDLSFFDENEVISFNHLSYIEIEILKRHLKEVDFKVFLHKQAESLEEVILSTSKQKETRSRVAEQIEISINKEIVKIAPQTSADLLATIPGVKVQKSQFGGGSPVLRGMEANKVLLVVDGVRMNNAIYRTGHLQSSITVSPSTLERTEVLFGPSSVIYGSDALGGVVHYYTKTPKFSYTPQTKVSFLSRYSSVNEEITNQGSVSFSFNKWASFTSFSYSDFQDLKMGENRRHGFEDWGKVFEYSNNSDTFYNPNPVSNSDPNNQKNTGYNQRDFLQKLIFKASEKSKLILNFQHSMSSDIPRFDRLTEEKEGSLKFAEWYYGPQKRTMISSQFSFEPSKKWMDSGTFTAAYQNLEESRIQRKFGSLDRSYRIENVDVLSFNGDFSIPLSNKSNRSLSYGIEVTHNIVDSYAVGKTLKVEGNEIIGFSGNFAVQSRYPDGGSNYTSSAIYTSYRQDVSKKGTLNTGIRFTNTWLNATWIDDTFITLPDMDINLNNGALTATVGYAYKPNDTWQLNSVLSSGFRSPNIDDIGKIREKNGIVTVPNVALKPEFAYSGELGAIKYLNDKNFNVGFNVYYTLLNNYIAREPFPINGSPTIIYDGEEVETYANVNHDNAYIYGSTLTLGGNLSKHFKTSASATYTKGRAYDSGLPLSSIPPLFGNVDFAFAKKRLEMSLSFRFNATKKIEDYNLIEGIDNIEQTPINEDGDFVGTPSWNSLNLYSSYNITKNLNIQFMIDNIFDNHYKEFASGISAPGRNYSISLIIN
ncbi:TonB-dependent receptor plug domain-containing protein [Urechidicola vernalis]|uniref:TonB-dependent receptor n=1 Tax=Urechidicola vernalis TaxID=3075600 RepID=A0ABU2Y7I4_9FLAO|nr:TonB-dependent receptor [Urechidicola sp. P050]MDT0553604.1 TonB-dependent receptor [Urechidicola sp. P050]